MNMRIWTGILATCGVMPLLGEEKPAFQNEKEKISYCVGMSIGGSFKRADMDVDLEAVKRGIHDVLRGGATLVSDEEMRSVLMEHQRKLAAQREEKRKQQAEKNKQAGEAFLAENKTKPGIVTLTNGVQYKVLVEGSGALPKPDDQVTVKYRGTLLDGTEFDNSDKQPQPPTVRVDRPPVRGWSEVLQKMKVGAKWQLFVPSELAYGDFGWLSKVEPGATVIYELELVDIKPPAPVTPPQPLTSDIIKVPSLEELKKGAKIETIKAEDVEKLIQQEQQKKQQEKAPEKK